MYKKILVISDNVLLCKEFDLLLEEVDREIEVTFSISPFSSLKDFELNLKSLVKIYNLKEENVLDELISNYDLIFSIHCKQLFPSRLVNNVKCINVHPGYNPINRGWYPQVFSIINDTPIGATIHEIDEMLDHGPIIARSLVDKTSCDTSLSLYNKVVSKEIELLKENINSIINNEYLTFIPKEKGNLYLKKDFNNLCKLNLNEELTLAEFINKLRGLTHGDYKNAYFIDVETNKKVYVNLALESE